MRLRSRTAFAFISAVPALLACGLSSPVQAQSIDELRDMPISALANLDVMSVTKSAETLGDAPASIYVITHDDIVRSGTVTLAGILRLAPNLQVMRGGSNQAVITARGLSGNETYQNFSNKLLVLIDGRTVYSPLYSGVYWDMQDVLPEDVDRIEVISGPGATLWGANAVNGVINIITRNAGATQGLYGTAIAGNRSYDAGLRYGGLLGENLNYRVFLKRHENFETYNEADDGSRRTQGGVRLDWSASPNDVLMAQADGYVGLSSKGVTSPGDATQGYDMLVRWNHSGPSGSALQVQAYYDHAARRLGNGVFGRFGVDTFDGEIQHSFSLGAGHDIVWGGGARAVRYVIENVPGLRFVPERRSLFLANLFVQDSITLSPSLTAIVGLKLEDGAYTGIMPLPSARISWKASDSALLWAAVSRAIRAPTPFDRDIIESQGSTVVLAAVPTFRSERLTAFEAGTRLTLSSQASLSISGYFNQYDDLRTIEPTPGVTLPFHWGNGIKGNTYGFDAWADVRLTDWWRVKPGYSLFLQDLKFKEGAIPVVGLEQAGNDAKHRASVRSSMDLGQRVNFDTDLRYVSALPAPYVASYIELGARLGWQFDERAEVSVSGFNLLHDSHQELPATISKPVARSVIVALKWLL